MRFILVLLTLLAPAALSAATPTTEPDELWVVALESQESPLPLVDVIPELGIGLAWREPNLVGINRGQWLAAVGGTVPAGRLAWTLDPLAPDQYALDQVALPEAWKRNRGAGVLVAVLDSGIDMTHPDFDPSRIDRLKLGQTDSPDDACGHGTAVAGALMAVAGNGIGIAGAAPDVRLLAVKVLDETCRGNTFDLAKGIMLASLAGADVISLIVTAGSAGSAVPPEVAAAIRFADARGALVIAAVGNAGVAAVSPPASDPLVLAVACTTEGRTRCATSSYGDSVDLAAPGEEILTTRVDGDYGYFTGTSLSVPYAAATAALVLSHHGPVCPKALRAHLVATATPMHDNQVGMGTGIVNASAALARAPDFSQCQIGG